MINTALCLPIVDTEALLQGQTILAMPRLFLQQGREFALFPVDATPHSTPAENYYRKEILAIKENLPKQLNKVVINAWAKCELCQIIEQPEFVTNLSKITIWTEGGLQTNLQNSSHIFIAYFRVYRINNVIELDPNVNPAQMGKFVGLPQPLNINNSVPVLADAEFTKWMENLDSVLFNINPKSAEIITPETRPILPPSIEEKREVIIESQTPIILQQENDLDWIKNLANVGNSSDGHHFEKLVRKSFIKLGFTNSNTNSKASLDPNMTGGAGGLDFYCEHPYQVVGECKATKSEKVPSSTPSQLNTLGNNHLQEKYDQCVKIIVVAGELTNDAKITANRHKINVIRPETLQRLLELKHQFPGAVDLFHLKKECFDNDIVGEEFDPLLNTYIDEIWDKIKVRSNLVEIVKDYPESGANLIEIKTACRYRRNEYPLLQSLQQKSVEYLEHILIELSSPLTGYLGRKTGENHENKYYFIRDFIIEK